MGSGLEDIRIPDDGDAPNKRALVIAAHPDDSEFGVAGTVALWARDGWEVYYLICTDGSKGSEDPEMTADKLVPMRREEQRCAGTVALDCVYPLARNRPTFPELLAEGLEPHSAKEVFLFSASEINYSVDITEVIDLKLEALSRHVSQMAGMESRLDQIRAFWRSEDGRYMENFRRIPIPF